MPDKFSAAPVATQGLILELINALTCPIEGLGAQFNENRVLTGLILADMGYVAEPAPTPAPTPSPEPTEPPMTAPQVTEPTVTEAPVIDTPPTS